MQIVVLTQHLARMQQAKALKEHVDASRHKEELKACVHAWIDETFTIIASIEGELT